MITNFVKERNKGVDGKLESVATYTFDLNIATYGVFIDNLLTTNIRDIMIYGQGIDENDGDRILFPTMRQVDLVKLKNTQRNSDELEVIRTMEHLYPHGHIVKGVIESGIIHFTIKLMYLHANHARYLEAVLEHNMLPIIPIFDKDRRLEGLGVVIEAPTYHERR